MYAADSVPDCERASSECSSRHHLISSSELALAPVKLPAPPRPVFFATPVRLPRHSPWCGGGAETYASSRSGPIRLLG